MATDHKPLVTLLGQKSLDQVANAQLFRIKQCIMWKFKVIHCPGKANFFADATLRRPVRSDNCKTLFIAANLAAIAISREEAAAEAQKGPEGPRIPGHALGAVRGSGPEHHYVQGIFSVSRLTLPQGWGPPV